MSEFWGLVDAEFGPAHARALVLDLVVDELGSRTAQQALDAGVEPSRVWQALCRALDVPPARRGGPVPPASRGPSPRGSGAGRRPGAGGDRR